MDFLFVDYWPWWLGGLSLSGLVIAMWLIEFRSLGVSGSFEQIVKKRTDDDKAFHEAATNDRDAVRDAMLKATLEEFGEEAVAAFEKEMAEEDKSDEQEATYRATSVPVSVHATFLAMLVAGGAISALLQGSWEVRSTLGPAHQVLMHGETLSWVALLIGGILVGFGTRMSGGCTSGHGLSGCSRLQPASLIATGSFFGTAIAVSFLLRGLL